VRVCLSKNGRSSFMIMVVMIRLWFCWGNSG
jgi:hypothetical protein